MILGCHDFEKLQLIGLKHISVYDMHYTKTNRFMYTYNVYIYIYTLVRKCSKAYYLCKCKCSYPFHSSAKKKSCGTLPSTAAHLDDHGDDAGGCSNTQRPLQSSQVARIWWSNKPMTTGGLKNSHSNWNPMRLYINNKTLRVVWWVKSTWGPVNALATHIFVVSWEYLLTY